MTATPIDLKTHLNLATRVARAAGQALAKRTPGWNAVRSETAKDIKLEADVRAEQIILDMLSAESPIPILSEEKGWTGSEEEYFWVVDPLDGTANYTQGIPFCCVAIALMRGGKPTLGVIYDFNHDELYAGAPGLGATLNDAPMRVSDRDTPETSVLCTGFPANRDYSHLALVKLAEGLAGWRKIRMIGSAALALAYVACGRADAYREEGGMLWDVAAGCALVEAAGGNVLISSHDDGRLSQVCAANDQLLKAIT